jgi:hypothetical protein
MSIPDMDTIWSAPVPPPPPGRVITRESTRAYLYRLGVAATLAAAAYGLVAADKVAVILGVLGALTNTLAAANTRTS